MQKLPKCLRMHIYQLNESFLDELPEFTQEAFLDLISKIEEDEPTGSNIVIPCIKKIYGKKTSVETSKALKLVNKTLGTGQHGVAIKLKSGLVLKKLFSDLSNDNNAKFYQYCQQVKPDEFLPVIKCGKDYIIISMEVKLDTPKCKKYFDEHIKAVREAYSKDMKGPYDFIPLIKNKEVREWHQRAKIHLEKLGLDFGEFWPTNIGEYEGRVVFLDA